MAEDKQIDRKAFFTEGPPLLHALLHAGNAPGRNPGAALEPRRAVLRPPGAAAEADFLDLCTGSAQCALACPADAILMLPREDGSGLEAPRIIPVDGACVVCDDLSCMKVCPTGALTLVPREEIRVGLAEVNLETCYAWNGDG